MPYDMYAEQMVWMFDSFGITTPFSEDKIFQYYSKEHSSLIPILLWLSVDFLFKVLFLTFVLVITSVY